MKLAEDIFQKIQSDDESYMENLYAHWRNEFKGWFESKYQLNSEESGTLYQDAFLAFYMNVKKMKIHQIEHPKTYLYGIGKNMMKQRFKISGRIIENIEDTELIDYDNYLSYKEEIEKKNETVGLLQKIGDPCRSLLLMFYFNNYSHEVIAERLGYKNDKVVKKKKSLCMTTLRKMLKELKIKLN